MTEPSPTEVRRLFDLVFDLEPGERERVLAEECGGDDELRGRVLAILGADEDERFLANATGVGVAPGVAAASEVAGETIDGYKLLQQIGEGGFGTVWLAEQREPVRRRVALKVIKLGMDTEQVIARFEAERQALALMDHPNIASVFDAGSTGTGRPYFVMEYIRGVPIVEYCDTERLGMVERLRLFVGVCRAIQHAHQKGVIHRDIKPSNVLVTLYDGVPVPKVIDFGVAKATNAELTSRTLFTEHRQFVGTPAYMSPEQAEMSALDVDTRSDVYSLGVLLYELLTGGTPFDVGALLESGFMEMMRVIREVEPERPSTRVSTLGDAGERTAWQRRAAPADLRSSLNGDLDWIVMRCLEKDRTRRYESASGLADDLERHLRDEPVLAGPPAASYRLAKFVRRNRGPVIAGGALAATVLLALVGLLVAFGVALDERRRADDEASAAVEAARAEERARSEAERELARATEMQGLLTKMLSGITPAEARGADTTLLARILERAGRRLANGEVRDELVAAEMHALLGSVYLDLALFDEAEAHLREARGGLERLLGPSAPATLGVLSDLGKLLRATDRLDAAEELHRIVLEERRATLGEDDKFTVAAWTELAALHSERGDHASALPILETQLERIRAAGPEQRHNVPAALSNVATTLMFLERHDEALVLARESVELGTDVHGEDHPDVLAALNLLGLVYGHLDDLDQAISTLERVLELERRVHGPDHPATFNTLNNLAMQLQKTGRYRESERQLLALQEQSRRVLGPEHHATLEFEINLINTQTALGRLDAESVAFYLERIEASREHPGIDSPTRLGTLANLGFSLSADGQHDLALEVLGNAHDGMLAELGEDSDWAAIVAEELARLEVLLAGD